MINNDQGRPYVHSTKCRWSWGALTGTTPAEWNKQVASQPIPEMLHKLAHRGFSGVWVDLYGYSAQASPEATLTAAVAGQPSRSANGRYLFYDIRPYTARMLSSEKLPNVREHPVDITFERGFYDEERDAANSWHWSRKRSRVVLINSLGVQRTVKLSMKLITTYGFPQSIAISGPNINDRLSVAQAGTYTRDVVLPANGRATIDLSCNCKRAANDPRVIYFGAMNLRATD
jgi:hypothetical protein